MKKQVRRRREMWFDIHANKTPPGTYLLERRERVLTRKEIAERNAGLTSFHIKVDPAIGSDFTAISRVIVEQQVFKSVILARHTASFATLISDVGFAVRRVVRSLSIKDYVLTALDYANSVVNGDRPAANNIRAKCAAFIDIMASSESNSFNRERANRACKHIETLRHVKGKWAINRELLSLEPWQVFFFVCVFGFGIRKVIFKVGRKNGISTMLYAYAYAAKKLGIYDAVALTGCSRRAQTSYENEAHKMCFEKLFSDRHGKYFKSTPKHKRLIIIDGGREPLLMLSEHNGFSLDEPGFLIAFNDIELSAESAKLEARSPFGKSLTGLCRYDVYGAQAWQYENECVRETGDPSLHEKSNPNIDVTVSREYLSSRLPLGLGLGFSFILSKHFGFCVGRNHVK